MNAFKRYIPATAATVLLAACAAFILCEWRRAASEPEEFHAADRSVETVRRTLSAARVSPDYRFGPRAAGSLRFAEGLDESLGRRFAAPQNEIAARVAYPCPPRPAVDPVPPDRVKHEYALAGTLDGLRAVGEQERVVVSISVPADMQHMQPLRIELFRGDARETVEFTRPYATVALQADARGGVSYTDTHVAPRRTYWYAARFVARMTVAPGTRQPSADAAYDYLVVHAPKEMQLVEPFVYAARATPPVSATVPASFQIRLAGTTGRVPAKDEWRPDGPGEYKATFAVRMWLPELGAWREETLSVAPGERVRGEIICRAPCGGANRSILFDPGYRLREVKWGESVRQIVDHVVARGPGGEPLMENGRPKMINVERQIVTPVEVAVLEDLSEPGQMEEFPKAARKDVRSALDRP